MSLVRAETVREHVRRLRRAGGTYETIGHAAGIGAMTVHCIANGRRPKVQAGVAEKLLAITPADIRDARPWAGGIALRLQALIAMGHCCTRMAAAIGVPPATLRRIVRGGALTVGPELRQAILALYSAWWDKRPPRRTRQENLAADNALKRAALNNWPTPASLDDDLLDQPGYKPQAGWQYATGIAVASDYPLGERKRAIA